MKKYINGIIVLLILSACGGGSGGTDSNGQQASAVTWESKFPSLWSVAYAADINPEDVTYEQFINTLTEKLKADTAFTNSVKGDMGVQGIQGIVGPAGLQGTEGTAGLDGADGTDGTDATLPSWETMYTFGSGDTWFYTCHSLSPCAADDITYTQVYVNDSTNPYYVASLGTDGAITGTDLLNTGAAMTNINASQNCEYKAEILTVNSGVDKVLLPSKIQNSIVTFSLKGAFTSQFDIQIGDASGGGPIPRISLSKRLPYSFAATQSEKDRIAYEFNNIGTTLVWQVVLKRRCSQP